MALNFLPSPGQITGLHLPHGPALRIDEGIYEGYTVPFYYDPLLCKMMTWGKTRDEAILRMKRAMNETKIEGIMTNIPFHRRRWRTRNLTAGGTLRTLLKSSKS